MSDYAFEEVEFNDLAIARFVGLTTKPAPTFDAHGGLTNSVTIEIPERMRRPSGGPGGQTNWFLNLVQQLIHEGSTGEALPHPVVGRVLKTGREVYLHDLVTRTAQRAMKIVMESHVERVLSSHVYSYRPRRSHLTALHHARIYMRRGYVWAAKADIRRFFPSISTKLLITVMKRSYPWVADDALALIRFFLSPSIYRDRDHPHVVAAARALEEPPQHCILQGSVLGPTLSNLVGHALIDGPFAHVIGERALLLRYADDLLILARRAADGLDAIDLLHDLVRPHFELHEEKTTGSLPIDTTREPVSWLGKKLVRGEVVTTKAAITQTLARLRRVPQEDDKFTSHLQSALRLMLLDTKPAFERFMTRVGRLSVAHRWVAEDLRGWWSNHRNRQLDHSAFLMGR